MNKFALFAAVSALAVGGVALAQTAADAPARNPQADLTRQQAVERADQTFQRLDTNNDGRFTPEEAQARREAHRAEREGQMFARLDGNSDGNISREEFAAGHARRAEHRGQRGQGAGPGGRRGPGMGMHRHGGPGGPGMQGGGRRGQLLFGEQGYATLEQFRERALTRFDRLDADRNGVVTAAERQAARQRWRGHRRGPAQSPSEG